MALRLMLYTDTLFCYGVLATFCYCIVICSSSYINWVSLIAQLVKNLPAMRETWVWSLGWEDPLRTKWLPTPLFWPGEFHGRPWGCRESNMTEWLSFHFTSLTLVDQRHVGMSFKRWPYRGTFTCTQVSDLRSVIIFQNFRFVGGQF